LRIILVFRKGFVGLGAGKMEIVAGRLVREIGFEGEEGDSLIRNSGLPIDRMVEGFAAEERQVKEGGWLGRDAFGGRAVLMVPILGDAFFWSLRALLVAF